MRTKTGQKKRKEKLVEGVQRSEKRSSLSAMIVTPINSIVSIVYQPRSNYSHYPSHPFVQASGLIPTNADSRPNSTPIRSQGFQSLSLDHWTIDPPSIRRRRRGLFFFFLWMDRSKSWGKTKKREREEDPLLKVPHWRNSEAPPLEGETSA